MDPSWKELPKGQAFNLVPGRYYAAIVYLKNNHTKSDALSKAADYFFRVGLWDEQVFAGKSTNSNYRYVGVQGLATASASIMWGSPVFWDDTTFVRVWESNAAAPPQPPWVKDTVVLPPEPSGNPLTPTLIAFGIMLVGIPAGMYLYRRVVKRRFTR